MSIDSTSSRRITLAADASPEKKFVPGLLPWIVAAAALLVYLLTINHWVSFGSLGHVAMVSGWNWHPEPELQNPLEWQQPLYWLVTYPFRFLPVKMMSLALNLFSAICAALTLGLLARSVALLPHDRTEEQRLRERNAFGLLSIRAAWLPVVLAVVVCGLQLSFWENATAASADMFDLLLFAYVLRCLLEFRLYGSDSWLLRSAFVYGAAMTNNWAMITFFPVFLVALVWTKGVGFFNLRFLRLMFVLGTLGLCFYLVLPIVASVVSPDWDFWRALKLNLGNQKKIIFILLNKYLLFQSERPLWILALYSLLPALAMSVRWPSYFGDPSKLGVTLATSILQVLFAALLLLCVWIALDPQISPRNYVGLPALPLCYLGTLAIGYFSGYFLLLFGGAKPMLHARALAGYPIALNVMVTGLIWVLFFAASGLLIHRNLPQIFTTNGKFLRPSLLREYADLLAKDLPRDRAVILSDDPGRLQLLKLVWAKNNTRAGSLLLDTHALGSPAYHRFLKREYPDRWTNGAPAVGKWFQPVELQQLIVNLSASNAVYYLHPSFGYYFEKFDAEPRGLVYRLIAGATNSVLKASLAPEILAQNRAFWALTNRSEVQVLLTAVGPAARKPQPGPIGNLEERLHLLTEPNREAAALAAFYSRSVNFWGVELQRNGHLVEAATQFELAKRLNPENIASDVNLQCNAALEANTKTTLQRTKAIEDQLGKYRTIQNLLNYNGAIDEATLCYVLAGEFFEGGNFRQAAQEYHRVMVLAPENIEEALRSRLLFARAAGACGSFDETLRAFAEIHEHADSLGLNRTNAPELLRIEAAASMMKSGPASVEKVVQTAIEKYPDDESLLEEATRSFLNAGMNSNAVATAEQQIRIRPDNDGALNSLGLAWLRLDGYSNAIPPLAQVVEMGTNSLYYPYALYNRAVAFQKSQKLEAAQKDLETLQRSYPTDLGLSYQIAEVAYQRKDTNTSIRNYQVFLSGTPPTNAPATSNALARLKELRRFSR
jgi:tetratricopeptide (TPR) repeat protein